MGVPPNCFIQKGFCVLTEKNMASSKFTILAFVILVSTTCHVNAGPAAYAACMTAVGGPSCLSAAASCLLPPLCFGPVTIAACFTAVAVPICGTGALACVPV